MQKKMQRDIPTELTRMVVIGIRDLELALAMPVVRVRIDPVAFNQFCMDYVDQRGGIDVEKKLEYYVGLKWLAFLPSDVFMDVASQDCPFASYIRQTFGCETYRQDLYHLGGGTHETDVRCDASQLPFADCSLSKIALFNSFEHFEGDKDTRFIVEAQRVLRPRGRLFIAPLEIKDKYSTETDAGWVDGKGRKHLWLVGARFVRTYDPEQLKARVLKYCSNFTVAVYALENSQELGSSCYLRYFAIFEKT
jgi:SAM-dependent methyltransferase